jgi:hypothetical protein
MSHDPKFNNLPKDLDFCDPHFMTRVEQNELRDRRIWECLREDTSLDELERDRKPAITQTCCGCSSCMPDTWGCYVWKLPQQNPIPQMAGLPAFDAAGLPVPRFRTEQVRLVDIDIPFPPLRPIAPRVVASLVAGGWGLGRISVKNKEVVVAGGALYDVVDGLLRLQAFVANNVVTPDIMATCDIYEATVDAAVEGERINTTTTEMRMGPYSFTRSRRRALGSEDKQMKAVKKHKKKEKNKKKKKEVKIQDWGIKEQADAGDAGGAAYRMTPYRPGHGTAEERQMRKKRKALPEGNKKGKADKMEKKEVKDEGTSSSSSSSSTSSDYYSKLRKKEDLGVTLSSKERNDRAAGPVLGPVLKGAKMETAAMPEGKKKKKKEDKD